MFQNLGLSLLMFAIIFPCKDDLTLKGDSYLTSITTSELHNTNDDVLCQSDFNLNSCLPTFDQDAVCNPVQSSSRVDHLDPSSQYETFVHNMKKHNFLDKGENIQVWAKVIPFPWQDNRLTPGISDPTLLKFDTSCMEQVVSKGVVARNMTVIISQFFSESNNESLLLDKSGNATFFIEIFDEMQEMKENIRAETEITVGCPSGRVMTVHRDVNECSFFENHTFVIPSGHYRSNFTSKPTHGNERKEVHYNYSDLGCPVEANYYDLFRPTLQLYENGVFLTEVTANYVLFELNGRTDYSFSATMEQVRCLREAQRWETIIPDETDFSKSWTRQNYNSCFISDNVQNPNLNQPYEILNKTGLSAIRWQTEGVYIFRATVVDPHYSFCDLTTVFAVRVQGIESASEELVPFLVLGTSSLGLLSMVFILYVTNK